MTAVAPDGDRHHAVISADGHLETPPDGWRRHIPAAHLDRAPSDHAAQHFCFCFGIVRDPLALRTAEPLPAERLLWGPDLPRSVTSFPGSRRWLDEMFAGTPAELAAVSSSTTPARSGASTAAPRSRRHRRDGA
jgi:hypothetical protein